MERQFKLKVNSIEKVEQLLQETYEQAAKHIRAVENEIDKLINSTNLADDSVSIDEKVKYGKAMHDYFGDKNKAINTKLDIAKFMGEIIKNSGDISTTLNDEKLAKRTTLDLKGLKEAINSDKSMEYRF